MTRLLDMKPPRIAMGLLLLTGVLWHLSPQNTVFYFPYKLIGTVCAASGFVIMMWGWALFKKARTGVCQKECTSTLVRTGAYRYTRNPMYLGMLLMLAGAAFFMGTIPSLLAPVAFFIIMDKVFIPFEEGKLLNSFVSEYSDYMEKTRRWI